MSTRRVALTVAFLSSSLAVTAACRVDEPTPRRAPEPAAPALSKVERGSYLVRTSGCHDCHTPTLMTPKGPAPDMSRALSGHPAQVVLPPPPAPVGPWIASTAATGTAVAGPWGVSFAANLTPDRATGLGAWTERDFINTVRNGRHLGAGRPLLPPMPWPVYAQMNDEDLGAIFAYLRTVPAIDNRVPAPLPPPVAAAGGATAAGHRSAP